MRRIPRRARTRYGRPTAHEVPATLEARAPGRGFLAVVAGHARSACAGHGIGSQGRSRRAACLAELDAQLPGVPSTRWQRFVGNHAGRGRKCGKISHRGARSRISSSSSRRCDIPLVGWRLGGGAQLDAVALRCPGFARRLRAVHRGRSCRFAQAAFATRSLANAQRLGKQGRHCRCEITSIALGQAARCAAQHGSSDCGPTRSFSSVGHNLKADDLFVMVNHGPNEAQIAADCCSAAGLKSDGAWMHSGQLSRHRAAPPVISPWRHA